jgi:hypothetical protein
VSVVNRQCVYESDHFGGGSVVVWAGICQDGRTHVKIVQGDGGEHVYRVHPINVQLVTDPVIMPAKEQHG